MTTRFKDFGTGTANNDAPISFALYGETFNCHPSLPGKFLLDLIAESSSDDPAESAAVVNKFFNMVLIDDETRERFNSLSLDPNRIVSVETLSDITAWLVEEYASRPTQQPEVSPSGQ